MKRIFGLDLIRTIAVIFVVSVHFFLNNGFYDTNIKGPEMFFSVMFRWIFYNGVPLFILLTGYLKNDKKLEKKYYKGINRVLVSYFFASILCIIFRLIYFNEHNRKLFYIVSIFDFSIIKHAWYIEMYIGLFLLIPFLNMLYKSLKTKKNKQQFIVTLLLLVSIGPLINYIKVGEITLNIIPDWWENLYPIAYYFIGAYIAQYKIRINKLKYSLILIGLILFETILTYLFNYNNLYNWNFMGGYASIQTIIISTIIFLLLYDINSDKKVIKTVFQKISILSLDIFLISYIVELCLYDILEKNIKCINHLKYMIPCILIVFIISFVIAYIKELLTKLIIYLNNRFRKKVV